MTTFKQEKERQIAERKARVLEAEEREAISEFYRRNIKTVRGCQAATEMIISYFNSDPITYESLQEAFDTHPNFRASLPLQTENDARDRLEKEIKALLTGNSSPGAVEEQLKSIRFRTTEDLRDWCARLKATKAARAKSAAELRAELRAATTSPELDLPEDIGAGQIKAWDPATMRHWIKKLGSVEPINRRLARNR
jgi:hypothetical protein